MSGLLAIVDSLTKSSIRIEKGKSHVQLSLISDLSPGSTLALNTIGIKR